MSDAGLILVAGALLAAGLGASLVAGRLRVPGLVLFLGVGHGDRLGRHRLDRTSATTSWRGPIGVIALALILFEGGLDVGLRRDPPRAAAGDLARVRRHARHRRDHRACRRRGCSTSPSWRGCCSARSWRRPTAPRSSRCCAARRCGGGSRARSRASPASTTRSRSCSCSGSSTGSSSRDYGIARHGVAVRARARDRAGGRAGRRAGWRSDAFGASASTTAGLYPVASIATAAIAYGGAAILHGSGFLAVYLAGLALGSAAHPGQADDHRLPRGPRLGGADHPLPHARPARVPEPARRRARSRGPWSPSCSCSSPGRSPSALATALESLQRPRAARPRLGGAARRRPGGARHLPGDRRRSAQPRVLQHRLLRGPDLDARPGHDLRAARAGARHDHHRAGAAAAADRDGDDPARSAPRSSSTRSGEQTRSPGGGSASSGCRARPCVNVIVRGDEAIPREDRPGSRPATACTSSSARRWPGVRRADRALAHRAGAVGSWPDRHPPDSA